MENVIHFNKFSFLIKVSEYYVRGTIILLTHVRNRYIRQILVNNMYKVLQQLHVPVVWKRNVVRLFKLRFCQDSTSIDILRFTLCCLSFLKFSVLIYVYVYLYKYY